MTPKSIPSPLCPTCGDKGTQPESDATVYTCTNCGTEMRYLPAGELLKSFGADGKQNSGWQTRFSVHSTEFGSSWAMLGVGLLLFVLVLLFLGAGQLALENAFWAGGSGLVLTIVGSRKVMIQKKKVQAALDRYPFWQKKGHR